MRGVSWKANCRKLIGLSIVLRVRLVVQIVQKTGLFHRCLAQKS